MELKITLLFRCYSNGIAMKIPVTLPLVLFHCYFNEYTSGFAIGIVSLLFHCFFVIPAFFFRQKGYINFVPKSVRHPSVTFLVNVSPPKPLGEVTSNFVAA